MNVVDSCGWLEFLAEGQNAAFFAPVLSNEVELLLPRLVVFEVVKRLHAWGNRHALAQTLKVMSRLPLVDLDVPQLAQAAQASQQYKLHMADAIIWQTAQSQTATLYTQDAALADLPGVAYRAKA